MKKLVALFLSLVVAFSSFAYTPVEIDKKLIQAFDSTFPNAADVSWHEYADEYVVHFVEGGVRSRIAYAKDQSYVRITRYYTEKHLPYHVRLLVKNQYPGKSIFGITEISTVSPAGGYTDLAFYVVVEDARKWLTVKIDSEGNSTIVQKAGKG